MKIYDESGNIPVLGLQEFRKGQLTGRDEFVYNELHGERHIHRPHKHDFFIINLFETAKGVHTIDFHDYPIGNRQIHVLFPGQVHTWSIKPKTTGYQLMIQQQFFERFAAFFRFSFSNYMHHPVIPLTRENFKLLKYEFDAIRDELSAPGSVPEVISARAAVIAAIVSKEAEHVFTDLKVFQSNPRLAKFTTLIDKYYKQEKGVGFYAAQLYISANYLNILCKNHLHVSATRLIQQRVLLEAKRLLQTTDLSIKEIAYELGFVDHAYFSNFFKSQSGITPTGFREG